MWDKIPQGWSQLIWPVVGVLGVLLVAVILFLVLSRKRSDSVRLDFDRYKEREIAMRVVQDRTKINR